MSMLGSSTLRYHQPILKEIKIDTEKQIMLFLYKIYTSAGKLFLHGIRITAGAGEVGRDDILAKWAALSVPVENIG